MTGQKLLKSFNLAIAAALVITSVTLPDGRAETPYSATLSATGGGAPYSWSVVSGDLPPDVTLASGGTFAGTPSTAGSYSFTVQAQDSVGALATKFLGMSVALPAVSVSVSPAAAALSAGQTQQFTANVLGTRNTGVAWKVNGVVGGDASTGSISSSGLYTAPSTVASSFSVTVTAASQANPSDTAQSIVTLQVPIAVQVSPGSAALSARQTQQFTATVTGTANTAVTWSLNSAVGTISSGGLYSAPPALPGPLIVAVTATSVADTSKQATASVTITPPVTVSLTPTAVTMLPAQGQTFTPTVGNTTNTGVTWSIAPATGTISSSGLYTAPSTISATSSVTVAATSVADATKSASAAIALIPPVQITTSSLPGGTAATAYNATVSATGGVTPYTWSVPSNQLPPGTSLSTSTGAISGTPTTAGPYNNITMKVTDAAGYQATAALAIVIAACSSCAPPPSISTGSLPGGTVGVPYTFTLTATGGTSPYTWSVAAGQLPTGLALASPGVLSGTPITAGSYSFTPQITDSNGTTASQPLTVGVAASTSTSLDVYGGSTQLPCPNGAAAHFYTQKIQNRWWLCTPLGNTFWMNAVYYVTGGGSYDPFVAAKYGSTATWVSETAKRLAAWNINTLGPGAYLAFWPNNPALATKLNVVHRVPSIGATAVISGNVKDIYKTANPAYWSSGEFPDTLDSRFATSTASVVSGDTALSGLLSSPQAPYLIGVMVDDTDYVNGFGAGVDFPTDPAGKYHQHDGLRMLVSSPVMTVNPNNSYAIYPDDTVYSKAHVVSAMQTKYTTIGALNTVWGSSYTAFTSTGTQYTGEACAMGNGTVGPYSCTVAHLTPSRFSVKVKVAATVVGADTGNGVIQGPSGFAQSTYTLGDDSTPGTVSLLFNHNITSGQTVTANYRYYKLVGGSYVDTSVTGEVLGNGNGGYSYTFTLAHGHIDGNETHILVDGVEAGNSWTVHGAIVGPGMASGMDYSTGTLGLLFSSPISVGTAITVDYVANGFGIGGGLADEDGRSSHTWVPSDPFHLTGATTAMVTDLDQMLEDLSDAYFSAGKSALAATAPNVMYFGITNLGTFRSPARCPVLKSAAKYVDVINTGGTDGSVAQFNFYAACSGDVPLAHWHGITADADSQFTSTSPGWTWDTTTQALRGAFHIADITSWLTHESTTPIQRYLTVGQTWWQFLDNTGENENFGLVTMKDNAYNGRDTVTGSVACAAPTGAYTCGGEVANYGDFITGFTAGNALWLNYASGSSTASIPLGAISRGGLQ